MKKIYLTLSFVSALVFAVNAQEQMDEYIGAGSSQTSSFVGNCTVNNMNGTLASGFLQWVANDASLYTWFDITGSPGCGMGYPYTLEQVDINIADPTGFGLPAGSGVGTLTYQINILDAVTPGDPCSEPGALIVSSGNQVSAYNDDGTKIESVMFNQVLNDGFFVEYKFISWTGPGPEVPSPLWDDDARPLCRQWVTNDGGTTLLDFTDFFTQGDLGWIDVTIDGDGTTGGGPANDDCTGVVIQNLNAGGSITFNGDNTNATDDGQGLGTPQVWEAFTTTECLDITLDYCGTPSVFQNGFLNLFDACPFVNFEAPDTWDQSTCVDGNWTINYTDIPAGTWYYAVMSEPGSVGPYTLNISGTACGGGGGPVNDDCSGAVALTPNNPCTPITGSVLGATESLPPITCNTFTSSDAFDVWFSFVATATSHDVEVTGAGDFDAIVEFFEGNCLALNSLFCADATVGGETEVINATGLTIGNTYYVRVYAWDGGLVDTDFDICVLGSGGGPINNSPNFEGFEAGFLPPCWMMLDQDGDGQNWFSYQVPGVAHTGDSCAASASWNGSPLNPDNYLILPQVTPGVDEHLTYWVASQDPAYPDENYSVVLSTTGTSAADFSTTLFTETLIDDVWQERTVDLSAYVGQNVYLAFRHHGVSDEFIIKLDDVQFPTETTPCGGLVNMSPNFEGFEGANFPPLCWNNLDEDGDGEMWFRDGNPGVTPNSGDSCALSASWINGNILTPENYLILPQVTPGVDEHLTYWVAAQDPAYPSEFYGIVVSTTGMAASDFSTELFSETLVDEVWVERTIDLSAYQGMDIYIAFKHYNVSDQFWMKIDDVQWPTETMPCTSTDIEETADASFTMFPNPSRDNVMFQSTNDVLRTIEIVDMSGRTVRNIEVNGAQYILERGELGAGVYFVTVQLDNGNATQKLIFE